MAMNLNQLKMFESVARNLNMTAAAEELHVSQPAISQQLKLLEEQHGARFFLRRGQRLELSEEGRAYLDAIRPILIQVENLERSFAIKQYKKQPSLLVVGATHGFCINVLPRVLMAFRESHPWVRVLLEANDSRVLEQRILTSEVEIALITHRPESPHIALQPYKKLEVVAVVAATSSLATEQQELRALSKILIVVRKNGNIQSILTEKGYQANICVECENSEAVKAAAQIGMGVGVLYRNVVEHEILRGDLKLLNVPELRKMHVESFIIYDSRRPLSRPAQDFLHMLRENRISRTASVVRKAS
jgi:LysR family transcriptional regulator, low CO2-responsive transcriptional regulator